MGTYRLEYLFQTSKSNNFDALVAYGLTKEIDAEFQLERLNSNITLSTFSASYNFISPVTDTFSYEVSDGRGALRSATIRITIQASNSAPVPSRTISPVCST